jgi:hypothetical protein
MYIRNYTPGVDLSWQNVFQTEQKCDVDRFCIDHGIEAQWNSSGPELTTKQVCQAVIRHSDTNESVWFNQAHLFHISALDQNDRISLIKELGKEHLPRNTFYGDGTEIELEVLEHIRKVYNEEKIKFSCQKGDLMILDNVLTAHAREPYKGERKVAVAMA